MKVIPPVAALRQAVIYRTFLDHIEPAEQRYHTGDVAAWLRRAIAVHEQGGDGRDNPSG